MGRPKGSKNKATDEDVTVLTPEDFDANVPADVPEVAAITTSSANTDNDAPTQGQLARAIQALADSAPVRRVPYAKFKTRSPFNPTGKRRKLTRRCYQNGYPMDIKKLTDTEIALLNELKPGKYISGLVAVVQTQNGGNLDLHLVYQNKTIDQRMALKSEFRNLKELLQRCVDEHTPAAPASV